MNLTLAQVAEQLQVHRDTVMALIHSGQLRAFRIVGRGGSRGTLRVRERDLESYTRSCELAPTVLVDPGPAPARARRPALPPGVAPAEPRWNFAPARRAK